MNDQKKRTVWEKAAWIEISWLLFLAGCLPIITIGTSFGALYKMYFDLRREKNLSVSVFREAYKGAIKNGIELELLQVITAIPLVLILVITLKRYGTESQGLLILIPLSIGILLQVMIFLYSYAYTGYFEQTVKATLKNCATMMITYTRGTMENLLLIIAAAVVPCLLPEKTPVMIAIFWILAVLPVLFYLSSGILFRMFRLYDPELNPKMRKILKQREETMGELVPEQGTNKGTQEKGD